MVEINDLAEVLDLLAGKEGEDICVEILNSADRKFGPYLVLKGRLGKIETRMVHPTGSERGDAAWLPIGEPGAGTWLLATRFTWAEERGGVVILRFGEIEFRIT